MGTHYRSKPDMVVMRETLLLVAKWLDDFYGPVEEYDFGDRGMVQLDHGNNEYEARMDVAKAVRRALGEGPR